MSAVINVTGFLGEYQLVGRVPTENFPKNPLKPTTVFSKSGFLSSERVRDTANENFVFINVLTLVRVNQIDFPGVETMFNSYEPRG